MQALAGRLVNSLSRLGATPFVQQRFAKGGKELLKNASFGGLFSGGITALATGNPIAGLAVGAADTLASAGIAKQIGKVSPRLAGKYYSVTPAGSTKTVQEFRPSTAQNIAMIGTSLAVPSVVEPIFASNQIAGLSQEDLQRLSAEPVVMDQTATTQQQVIQRTALDNIQVQSLSPGTMFQMQGLESTMYRPPAGLDPYGLTRGSF
jgi:hypothetical protein